MNRERRGFGEVEKERYEPHVYIYGCVYLSNRDILQFMWKVQHKYYGFWLRGYTICACTPDISIKAIAEAGSTT